MTTELIANGEEVMPNDDWEWEIVSSQNNLIIDYEVVGRQIEGQIREKHDNVFDQIAADIETILFHKLNQQRLLAGNLQDNSSDKSNIVAREEDEDKHLSLCQNVCNTIDTKINTNVNKEKKEEEEEEGYNSSIDVVSLDIAVCSSFLKDLHDVQESSFAMSSTNEMTPQQGTQKEMVNSTAAVTLTVADESAVKENTSSYTTNSNRNSNSSSNNNNNSDTTAHHDENVNVENVMCTAMTLTSFKRPGFASSLSSLSCSSYY